MVEPDYRALHPEPGETRVAYCTRLEADGYEEALIRKALAEHFSMSISEMGAFFESFPAARLRHIALVVELAPNRTEYSLTEKLSRNLGIPREAAALWVARYRQGAA